LLYETFLLGSPQRSFVVCSIPIWWCCCGLSFAWVRNNEEWRWRQVMVKLSWTSSPWKTSFQKDSFGSLAGFTWFGRIMFGRRIF
jgi:hypothetical protein